MTNHQSWSTKGLAELPSDVFADIWQTINASIDCDGRHRTVGWRSACAATSAQTAKRRKGKNKKKWQAHSVPPIMPYYQSRGSSSS
jgi:hypothetical protein